ncbi:hypothetical protein DV738_g1881, partial [Chaetothyriales sp. CBS 135597]
MARDSNKRRIPAEYPHPIAKYAHDEKAGCEHSATRMRIVNDKLIEDIHDEQEIEWPVRWYKRGLSVAESEAELRAMKEMASKTNGLGLTMPPFKVIKATYLKKCNGEFVNLLGKSL